MPRRLRILGDQLRVGESGDCRNGDTDQEGHPEGPAHCRRDEADEHVDARAENVPDHVEVQLSRGDGSLELAVLSQMGL